VPSLLEHAFAFLSYLNRVDVTPLHGRWLAPRHYRALAPFLAPHDEATTAARSERQARYLAFLHYLAERAGLVALLAGRLVPTTEAARWLGLSLRERLERLWRAWGAETEANDALWARYHLPLGAIDRPTARFRRLCGCLTELPPQDEAPSPYLRRLADYAPDLFRPPTAYRHWAALDDEARTAYHEEMEEALAALLRGPLAWFGVLRAEDERRKRSMRVLRSSTRLTITCSSSSPTSTARSSWSGPGTAGARSGAPPATSRRCSTRPARR
jgi:hypothetical protein